MRGFMFPGQGAQNPQMLIPIRNYKIDVSNVFKTVSEGFGFDVEKLIETSTQEVLNKTQYTQMVMFASDMAYYEILNKMGMEADWVAGHSLGQYAAFVAAGVLDLYETAQLIRQRSNLMGQVSRKGKLCAISSPNLDINLVNLICKDIEDSTKLCIRIALYNSKWQIVVGGEPEAISQLVERVQEMTDYMTKVLAVGQAFHTPIMDEMIEAFQVHIRKLNIQKPKIPIILNCSGQVLELDNYNENIQNEMTKQCDHPVQWIQTMQTMVEMDTKSVIEVGLGHSLCGLLKNTTRNIKSYHMDDRKFCMQVLNNINFYNTN